MIKRLTNLFQQDLKVAVRNYFHLVIIILALLMVVVVNFIIPAEVKLTPGEIFLDNTPGKQVQKYLMSEGLDKNRFVNNREELFKRIEADSNTLGVILEGTVDNATFTVIGQGHESRESVNLLKAALASILDHMKGTVDRTNHRVERLHPQSKKVPFNKQMIPIFIFTEVIMLGFLLVAVMVFQEKKEGGVRAYRVSPGGTLEYILSKVGTNLLLALLFAVILIVLTLGLEVNFISLLITIILANIFMTLIGLTISVFFKNLEEFIFVGILFLSIFALPMVSYLTPSFAPPFITWIPSYPVLFGLREILFPTGRAGFISSLNWMLVVENLIVLAISYLAVHRKLMREDK
ncbi:ABC transporter permease [Halothermothrix orenii]|uniref:ABC-2 type transporter n=1 Tax=Halothermothrix orenii (strain H 168 / OCM 544 / DSM 9562) TaxID=373903 RepID=B8D1Q4_HALOH|nr:ABC transporter permease [Halothermothrix orenii]ACL69131.1 ABC-2 type transporter [Halothermothrix orenii H 168]